MEGKGGKKSDPKSESLCGELRKQMYSLGKAYLLYFCDSLRLHEPFVLKWRSDRSITLEKVTGEG